MTSAECVVAPVTNPTDPQAQFLALFLPFALGMTTVSYARLRRRPRSHFRISDGMTARRTLSVSFRPLVCAGLLLMVVGSALNFIAMTAIALYGLFSSTEPTDVASTVTVTVTVTVTILALLAAYFTVIVIDILLRRIRGGMLSLGPEMLIYRNWGHSTSLRWEDIGSIRAEAGRSGQLIAIHLNSDADVTYAYHSTFWKSREKASRALPYVPIESWLLAADPTVVLSTLKYYHAHPEARVEIGTQAACQRIIKGGTVTR